MKKETIISVILTLLSLAVTFTAGYYTNHLLNPPELDLPILSQAKDILENHAWYTPPNQTQQEYGMIQGLVAAYDDPYASFVEPAQHELYTNTFEGRFGGIGAEVTINEQGEPVLYPYPDSPAQRAGILAEDILISVDGTTIDAEVDLDTTVSMLRGPVGERVTIAVFRSSDETVYQFEVRREEFQIPSVTWRLLTQNPQVGLLQVNLIASSTPEEVEKAVTALQSDGAVYFVLDLRGNFGGLLDSGIDVARLFLGEGTIIIQQLAGNSPEVYEVSSVGPLSDIPLVVLIDHNTASAAEIIAGALQHHDRSALIGTPSYGKNTIQLVFNLQDNSSIHVTAGKWWFPGEENDLDFRLVPDIPIQPENYSDDLFYTTAIETLVGSN